MRLAVFLLSVIMLLGIAGASTVTLTGSCYSKIINQTNNYIQFNLTNSGNGSATNLLLEPIIQGATPINESVSIPLVAPSGFYPERIYLTNFSSPGSYVERFVARYSQGSSTFITIFPCLVNIGQSAQSLLGITSVNRHNSDILVNISNIADYPISAQVAAYAPPEFTITPSSKNTTVNQYALTNVSFALTTPQYTNAEFPVAIAVSYTRNGVHYATLAVTTITFGSSSSVKLSNLGSNILLIAIAIVIALVVILIIWSIIRNSKRRSHPVQP